MLPSLSEENPTDALFTAIRNHDVDKVKKLIKTEVDANVTHPLSGTPALEMAASHPDNQQIVEVLIQAKADLNIQAFISAAYFGCPEVINLLIKAGAKVNEQNKLGRTALMEAAFTGNDECVKRLLKANANTALKNDEGEDALAIAKEMGHTKVIRVLRIASLKLRVKNGYVEFKKRPSYYLFSATIRLALGAFVGYGLFYGLSALFTLPYLATLAQSLMFPKMLAPLSLFGGLWASIKLANSFLLGVFGEIKLEADIRGTNPLWAKLTLTYSDGYFPLSLLFNKNCPYKTSLEEVVDKLERSYKSRNVDNPHLPKKSRVFALAFAKKLVEQREYAPLFSAAEKEAVKTEPYISALAKLT